MGGVGFAKHEFCEVGNCCLYYCNSNFMVRFENVAAELCLQNRAELVDFFTCWCVGLRKYIDNS